MRFSSAKSLFLRAFLWFSLSHILLYSLYHVSYVFMLDSFATYLFLIHTYLSRAWLMVFPALSASLMLTSSFCFGVQPSLLWGSLLSVSSVFHSVPYFYVELINYGFDSIESLTIAILFTGVAVALSYAFSAGIFGIARLIILKEAKRTGSTVDALAKDALGERVFFDTSYVFVRCVFAICLCAFALPFGLEIYNIISFISEAGSSVELVDLLIMISECVCLIGALIATHAISVAVKNRVAVCVLSATNEVGESDD